MAVTRKPAGGSTITETSATGAAALSTTTAVPSGAGFKLQNITCHLSAAPTTAENFVVTLDAGLGAAYDTVLYSVDPSNGGVTDIVLPSELRGFQCQDGDQIKVAYTNTDTKTYGLRIVTEGS